MELQDARRYRELEKENGELKKIVADQMRGELKKMVSPSHKRQAVQFVMKAGLCSERRACRYLGLQRSSGRYRPMEPSAWL